MNRMTDERLAKIEEHQKRFPHTVQGEMLLELLQALKAEREAANGKQQRIRELEAEKAKLLDKLAALQVQHWGHKR